MKNYLFSTTRQWNPGDEFILHGILRVFRFIDEQFNPIIFNRNPEIKHREGSECYYRMLKIKKIKPGFYDNSFKKELLSSNFVDLVIFAGTPEWASPRMKILYDYIEKHSIPVIYLGIGVGSEDFNFDTLDAKYKNIISRALLITARDTVTEKALSSLGAHYLPCPAFISAPPELEKKIDKIEKIGLIYMSDTGVRSNKINSQVSVFLIDLYKEILRRYRGGGDSASNSLVITSMN